MDSLNVVCSFLIITTFAILCTTLLCCVIFFCSENRIRRTYFAKTEQNKRDFRICLYMYYITYNTMLYLPFVFGGYVFLKILRFGNIITIVSTVVVIIVLSIFRDELIKPMKEFVYGRE